MDVNLICVGVSFNIWKEPWTDIQTIKITFSGGTFWMGSLYSIHYQSTCTTVWGYISIHGDTLG